MTRAIAVVALMIATSTALSGCTAPQPLILNGDANSVEVTYAGNAASALPVARQHCARYERIPRLVNTGSDFAIFDCVAARP
jgi:hypothetical protein